MFNRVREHIRDLGNFFGQLKLEAEPVEKDRHQFFKTKDSKGLKDTFDELASDYRVCSREQLFKVTVDLLMNRIIGLVGGPIVAIVRYF
jgi:hypothetical protein